MAGLLSQRIPNPMPVILQILAFELGERSIK